MVNNNEFFWDNENNFVFVARGLFQSGAIKELKEMIHRTWKAYEYKTQRDIDSAKYGVAPDSIRLNEDLFEVWKSANIDILPDALGEYTNIIFPPMIRHVQKDFDAVPWHQDVSYIKNIKHKKHDRAIICFTPLDEDPSQKATLQFSLKKGQIELMPIIRDSHEVNVFDLKDEDKPNSEECVSFELEQGAALIFGMLTLHKTLIKDSSMHDRLSVEFRITTENGTVPDKDYFNIHAKKMIKG